MEAEVTVLPVPGGPWMRARGDCRAVLTAMACEALSWGSPGALNWGGREPRTVWGSTSWPSSLHTHACITFR